MSDRKRVYYTWKTIEAWESNDKQATEIIKADTKQDVWICNRALPPTCYPPPMTTEGIDKLKALDDIVVQEIEEE
ncbi:uncharacterized protein BO66DRAFT_475788 [Aspergillus aculeatinus CBS 121060]|uniref:Uncharacterized protein n=1 Tax=Aspergillus aculeatinus CBS 121060 TaxID=1448322 RepID=A0ACD1GSX1_9EURO|nr:hypothetical protein BO66DRAFT_475788 [Aspergillus aculeatinus CBS 121060]RAH64430.1 hypothetical protein BO66DRAFT_475788 [Aspergillus aculeatinus CBS 121060]